MSRRDAVDLGQIDALAALLGFLGKVAASKSSGSSDHRVADLASAGLANPNAVQSTLDSWYASPCTCFMAWHADLGFVSDGAAVLQYIRVEGTVSRPKDALRNISVGCSYARRALQPLRLLSSPAGQNTRRHDTSRALVLARMQDGASERGRVSSYDIFHPAWSVRVRDCT